MSEWAGMFCGYGVLCRCGCGAEYESYDVSTDDEDADGAIGCEFLSFAFLFGQEAVLKDGPAALDRVLLAAAVG